MAKKRKKPKAGLESPTSDCLLLCDDVFISQGKGKHNLVGLIGGIVVQSFPAQIGGYVAYTRFRNVYSGKKISLRFTSAGTNEALFEIEVAFPEKSDPLGIYTIMSQVPPFVVREAGDYLFGAYDNEVPIALSPIKIIGVGG